MKRLCFVLMIMSFPVTMFAQYTPVNGGEDVADFLSPSFLAEGASVTSMESPSGDLLNPAVSGLKQRTVLDLSYLALLNFDSSSPSYGYRGHAANLGTTIPSKYGVFNLSGHFLHAPYENVNLGTLGGVDFSFAKDLFPNFLIGAGIHTVFGYNTSFDWGLSLNLGFLHLPGDIGFMKDFVWGFAMQGMGKWFSPIDGYSGYPAPFTPVLGARFSLIKTENINWGWNLDVGFPSFQNMDITVGTSVRIADSITLSMTGHYDIVELTDPSVSARSFIPGFGIAVHFTTNIKEEADFFSSRGWNKNDVKIQAAAAPLQGEVWAVGAGVNIPFGLVDAEGPVITVEYPEKQYISPNHDGKEDTLVLPITIEEKRYIKGYSVQIYNENDELVREIKNKEKRPENIDFKNIIDRLTYVKSGIEVPGEIRWDGKTETGSMAPDGEYYFKVEAWDDNDNVTRGAPREFVVDSTQPEIEIEVEEESKIFSPNGDGLKDTITLVQNGSSEDKWEGAIKTVSGETVKTFSWEGSPEPELVWDGRNDEGTLVPDGVYVYEISSTDRAGNSGSGKIENIIINTQSTPISLAIDKSVFAPGVTNTKEESDVLYITPNIPVRQGIVSWKLEIRNTSGALERTFSGDGEVPDEIEFDGRKDTGGYISEGSYYGHLQVRYENGNLPDSKSPVFSVDVTQPVASVTAAYRIFSPNGDGNKDQISFLQDTSREKIWLGTIYSEDGEKVKTFTWVDRADTKISWDGYTSEGTLAPDGTYIYMLEAVDEAGNKGNSQPLEFTLDTEDTPVLLAASEEAFSPNGDGIKDRLELMPQIKELEGIQNYRVEILNENNAAVKTYTGRGIVPDSIPWDGFGDDGSPVNDGNYYAKLRVEYAKGNVSEAQTRGFTVDTQFPDIEASIDYMLFSPDGDGLKDAVTLEHQGSYEEFWDARILNGDEETIVEKRWHGTPETFVWKGTDEAGNTVPDGEYTYRIWSEDRAGNRSEFEIEGISIDTRQTGIFCTADKNGFSPNGDGIVDTITFTTIVNLTENIQEWNLELIHESGTVEKVFTGGAAPPSSIVWDGKGDSGEIREGNYTAQFTVIYMKGNAPSVEIPKYTLDISPPEADITLRPQPFSPDNDGIDDELYISMDISDESDIDTWSFIIRDPKNRWFYEFSGEGKPAERLVWDGKSEEGELVLSAEDYPWEFTISDSLGNAAERSGLLPVDILVIREGDRLKIRISNINFEPNSPELTLDETETGEKNQQVLKRLAEILNKYDSYRIQIEGHAVSVYWYDKERAEREQVEELLPLSKSRAETVKRALSERGVDGRRITTKGLGGSDPIVPHGDLDDRWKNRRVEFILLK
jgi:flagellar hook assembly protein FlgD/outer membrane protein OmpA-like peptidoglycan-associated protein